VTPLDQDRENLRLLSIFYYIWAGMQALGGLIGLGFVGMGTFLSFNPQVVDTRNAPPPWFGAVFAGVGALIFVACEAFAVLSFLTGRFLARRQHRTFCIVISAMNCMSLPLGTALGVFTILVLSRPSVKEVFSGVAAPPPAPFG
jgi:hypothetical protein